MSRIPILIVGAEGIGAFTDIDWHGPGYMLRVREIREPSWARLNRIRMGVEGNGKRKR